jgi:hypothetical protein
MIHTTVLGVPQVIIHEHGSPVQACPNIDIYALITSTRCQSKISKGRTFPLVPVVRIAVELGSRCWAMEEASIPELRNGRERRWLRGG